VVLIVLTVWFFQGNVSAIDHELNNIRQHGTN
jgi:hypothetical protein